MKRIFLSSVIFLFSFVFLFSTTSLANNDISISKWIVNAILGQNGDLYIAEDITFTFNSNLNGVYKNIVLKKTDKIENLSISEVVNGKEVLYERVKVARGGDTNKFTLKQDKDNIRLKIFSLSTNPKKTFRLKYIVNNIAVQHSDTAELYYKFLNDENKTNIDYFCVNLQLPGFDKDRIKIFTHGPTGGRIYFSDEIIKYEARNIKNGQSIKNRILFPKEYIELSTNKGSSDFASIVQEENTHLLKIEKLINRKELKKKDLFRFTIYLVLLLGAMLLLLFSKLKRYMSTTSNKTSL